MRKYNVDTFLDSNPTLQSESLKWQQEMDLKRETPMKIGSKSADENLSVKGDKDSKKSRIRVLFNCCERGLSG